MQNYAVVETLHNKRTSGDGSPQYPEKERKRIGVGVICVSGLSTN